MLTFSFFNVSQVASITRKDKVLLFFNPKTQKHFRKIDFVSSFQIDAAECVSVNIMKLMIEFLSLPVALLVLMCMVFVCRRAGCWFLGNS